MSLCASVLLLLLLIWPLQHANLVTLYESVCIKYNNIKHIVHKILPCGLQTGDIHIELTSGYKLTNLTASCLLVCVCVCGRPQGRVVTCKTHWFISSSHICDMFTGLNLHPLQLLPVLHVPCIFFWIGFIGCKQKVGYRSTTSMKYCTVLQYGLVTWGVFCYFQKNKILKC